MGTKIGIWTWYIDEMCVHDSDGSQHFMIPENNFVRSVLAWESHYYFVASVLPFKLIVADCFVSHSIFHIWVFMSIYLFIFFIYYTLSLTFVNCGHLKIFLLLPDLKIW